MLDLTGIAVAVLSLLAAWVTTQVIPWIKARTTTEQRRVARQLIQTAVYAAEQLYKGAGRGEEKLRYVEGRLADAGIKLDVDVVTDMIEAAVLELAVKREWGKVEDHAPGISTADVYPTLVLDGLPTVGQIVFRSDGTKTTILGVGLVDGDEPGEGIYEPQEDGTYIWHMPINTNIPVDAAG